MFLIILTVNFIFSLVQADLPVFKNTFMIDHFESNEVPQFAPAVAALQDSTFVIAYGYQKTSYSEVLAQRYDSTGSKLGGRIVVATALDGGNYPYVLAKNDGKFVVYWMGWDLVAGTTYGCWARVYTNYGLAVTITIKLNEDTGYSHTLPQGVGLSNGFWAITWRTSDGLSPVRVYDDGTFINGFDYTANNKYITWTSISSWPSNSYVVAFVYKEDGDLQDSIDINVYNSASTDLVKNITIPFPTDERLGFHRIEYNYYTNRVIHAYTSTYPFTDNSCRVSIYNSTLSKINNIDVSNSDYKEVCRLIYPLSDGKYIVGLETQEIDTGFFFQVYSNDDNNIDYGDGTVPFSLSSTYETIPNAQRIRAAQLTNNKVVMVFENSTSLYAIMLNSLLDCISYPNPTSFTGYTFSSCIDKVQDETCTVDSICPTDYCGTGAGIITCNGGSWEDTSLTGCSPCNCYDDDNPTSFTGYTFTNCIDKEQDETCTADSICPTDYCGTGSGIITCNQGSWEDTSLAGCSPCNCNNDDNPTSFTGYTFSSCIDKVQDETCTVDSICPTDYCGTGSGIITCNQGSWEDTSLTGCALCNCYDDDNPTSFTGYTFSSCIDKVQDETCTVDSICPTDYCGTGAGIITCNGGSWEDTSLTGCSPCNCYDDDNPTSFTGYTFTNCIDKEQDETCTADSICPTDYCGTGSGIITCNQGSWEDTSLTGCALCNCYDDDNPTSFTGYSFTNCIDKEQGETCSTNTACIFNDWCGTGSGIITCNQGSWEDTSLTGCALCNCYDDDNPTSFTGYSFTNCIDKEQGETCTADAICPTDYCGTGSGVITCNLESWEDTSLTGCALCNCYDDDNPTSFTGYSFTNCIDKEQGETCTTNLTCTTNCGTGSGIITCNQGSWEDTSLAGCKPNCNPILDTNNLIFIGIFGFICLLVLLQLGRIIFCVPKSVAVKWNLAWQHSLLLVIAVDYCASQLYAKYYDDPYDVILLSLDIIPVALFFAVFTIVILSIANIFHLAVENCKLANINRVKKPFIFILSSICLLLLCYIAALYNTEKELRKTIAMIVSWVMLVVTFVISMLLIVYMALLTGGIAGIASTAFNKKKKGGGEIILHGSIFAILFSFSGVFRPIYYIMQNDIFLFLISTCNILILITFLLFLNRTLASAILPANKLLSAQNGTLVGDTGTETDVKVIKFLCFSCLLNREGRNEKKSKKNQDLYKAVVSHSDHDVSQSDNKEDLDVSLSDNKW